MIFMRRTKCAHTHITNPKSQRFDIPENRKQQPRQPSNTLCAHATTSKMKFHDASKRVGYLWNSASIIVIVLITVLLETSAFQPIQQPSKRNFRTPFTWRRNVVHLFNNIQDDIDDGKGGETIIMTPTTSAAKTGTVNERLMAELKAMEKSGTTTVGSTSNERDGKSNKLKQVASFFKSSKTDAERRAAIAEAQNLNGVNPVTTLFGAFFALACSVGLWWLTQSLAAYFALHPSDSDIYFVERVTLLSRNIIMGLSALASGFFGVTGMGILLLAIRVGFGVVTGELDPTPIASNQSTTISDDSAKVDIGNVWDMMMNRSSKKGQR